MVKINGVFVSENQMAGFMYSYSFRLGCTVRSVEGCGGCGVLQSVISGHLMHWTS